MNTQLSEQDIAEAIESIREIKKTLRNNIQFLRPYFYDKRFVVFCFIFAAFCALFFGALHCALLRWNHFLLMPLAVKIAFCAIGALAIIASGTYKTRILLSALKINNSLVTVESLLSKPELRQLFIDEFIMFAASLSIAIVIGLKTDSLHILVTVVFLLNPAFQCLHFAQLFYLPVYRIIGVVLCMAAILTALFIQLSPVLWIGATASIIFAIFGFAIYLEGKRK